MATVWIVVDDTDPRIEYFGSWGEISNSHQRNKISHSGVIYNDTLHLATNETPSGFAFRFNGTAQLGLYGTVDTTLNPSLPAPGCFLDGENTWTFGTNVDLDVINNNYLLCHADSMFGANNTSPGEHELIVVHDNSDSALIIDYIVYESIPSFNLNGETLQIGNRQIQSSQDPHLQYKAGWNINDNDEMETKVSGSSVAVVFNGTAVQFFGNLKENMTNTISYSIDNQPPVDFQLSSPNTSSFPKSFLTSPGQFIGQPLFNLSALAAGEHSLVVFHNGTAEGTPLVLDYLFVTSLTEEEQASQQQPSAVTGSIAPTRNPSESTSPNISLSSNHREVGVIIGATVGSILFVILLGAWMVLWRKRRQTDVAPSQQTTPFTVGTAKSLPGRETITILDLKRSRASGAEQAGGELERSQPSGQDGGVVNMRVNNLKLEQRIAVMHDQVQQQDRHVAEQLAQRSLEPVAEFPPNYTMT
ncbi:hypothetical protein K435DRAFT_797705 [Dendrothele bispora CBS 962.96]|uniref:Uncharacterized protein n=1 Tax=Dendrothele bispora (strain CBS 962.96) TaxID=1314807 RepID=A0A4S8L946_DENBC|nr:hypothetical protein K435DRAFT_806065 [Dendrothele bispora CBS 962.96]THU96017.1 hypothetical protein K435DRAFT_797705 [Dendrothele bispora CBS 962.96]